jgi:hypothetical protein
MDLSSCQMRWYLTVLHDEEIGEAEVDDGFRGYLDVLVARGARE